MKIKLPLLILSLLAYVNSFSQCPNPDIFWFQTGEDFVYIDGNNNNQIDYYEIEYKANETFIPGDGTAEIYTFSSFPNTIPNLTPGTPYYFTNRAVCNDGSVSLWNDNLNDGPDLWYTNMEPGEFFPENTLSHNSSQEITHEPSQICETISASYDFIFNGSNQDPGVSCPETSFTATLDGPYTITITDSYGDGWVGNAIGNETYLDVLVNGTLVLDDITLENGVSQDFEFDALVGDEISTSWQNEGTWFYEVGYSIISQNAPIDEVSVAGQIYHRSYIPADFGYDGNVTIGAVELGIWYSDAEGNYNPDLPTQDFGGTSYQNIFLYRHTTGGVGTSNIGQDQANFELIGFSLNFEITPEDHLSVITVPLTFLPGFGELNGNGVEVSADDEFVIQVWMAPGDAASTGFPGGVRKFIAGNTSDFTVSPDNTTNYPYPTVQAGTGIDPNSACEFYNYVPDNTSLMNLVIGQNQALSTNSNTMDEINIYPNPLEKGQLLNINSMSQKSKTIQIFDISGRMVLNKNLNGSQLDVSVLESGTYIVKVEFENKISTKKLIIN